MSLPNLCGFGIIHSEQLISEQEPPPQAFPQLNSFTLNVNILSALPGPSVGLITQRVCAKQPFRHKFRV